MKRSYTLGLIILILGAWVGNLWYFNSLKLEKPLFLKHYYEVTAGQLNLMMIYYISNQDSNLTPFQIQLTDGTILYIRDIHTRDDQGRLVLHEAAAYIPDQKVVSRAATSISEQVTVFYNNGTQDTVPIGSIIVHPEPTQRLAYTQTSGGSGSDGKGYSSFTATRDTTIQSIKTSFPDLLTGIVSFDLDGKNINENGTLPLNLKAGESVKLSYQFLVPPKDNRRYNAYNLLFTTHEAASDDPSSITFLNMQPNLYKQDLADYVRYRKEVQP